MRTIGSIVQLASQPELRTGFDGLLDINRHDLGPARAEKVQSRPSRLQTGIRPPSTEICQWPFDDGKPTT
jgi:hypothetical protein